MLRNTKLCNNICRYFTFKYNCYRRLEPRELKCQYQCRLFSSKDGKPTIDPCATSDKGQSKSDEHERPPNDTATMPPIICKQQVSAKPGTPALMDQLPKPSVNCKWEDERKKHSFKRTLILVSGLLLFALTLIPVYNKFFPHIDLSKDDGQDGKKKRRKPWVVVKNPSNSMDIPDKVPYLLIGGGTASFSAFRAIKSLDPEAKVLVIGNEPYYPYMRPPLSKEIFSVQDRNVAKKLKFKQWNGTERSLFYEPDDFYTSCKELDKEEHGGVAVARGWTVKKIDATNRIAYLDDKTEIEYEKCLIATGSKPKEHPVFEDVDEDIRDRVSLYRNIFDFEELEEIIEDGAKSIVVIGGSFLGSELACALARRGKRQKVKVTQIIKESGNMGKILPEYLSKWTTYKVKKEGVNVITNMSVEDCFLKDDRLVLSLSNYNEVVADHVVLALGVKPNTDLAEASNLEVDKDQGGFLVNAELEARSNLFVAGDCACFYDAKLGRRRVEHHDHAVVSGRLAGENMTGAGKPYWHQSMFWSDLGPDVGYEAIGIIDASLPTVGVYAKVTKSDKPEAIQSGKDSDGMRSTTEEQAGDMKDLITQEEGENEVDEEQLGEEKEGSDETEESEEEAEAEDSEVKEEMVEDSEDGKEKQAAQKKGRKGKGKRKPKEEEDYGKGVIFYLRDGIVVGIVLWNVFNRMTIARQVLSDERKYEDLNEVAKLFNIHKD